MKIVVLDGKTLNPGDLSWSAVESLGDCVIYDRTPADAVLSRIGDAEIVLTNKTPITAQTIAEAPRLRYIGVLATGYNVVDVEAAKARSVVVTNIPAYSTEAVAQFTFALLLEICHHAGEHSRAVLDGEWVQSPDFAFWHYPLMSLQGKTMGIVGFGQIGQAVAKIAQAFSMNVLVYSRTVNRSLETDTLRFVPLDELLANADVVSLHCPLTPETNGLINQTTLAKMKKSAILINTSRGAVVVENDLKDALNSGVIFAAAADVASIEPMRADNPLLLARNMILTPHIAWAPLDCRERLMAIASENIRKFLEGTPVNVING